MKYTYIMCLSSLCCNRNIDKTVIKQLKSIPHPEQVKPFSFKGQSFWGLPTNIYDGDTLSILFYHNGNPVKYRCRTLGYDSPEMKPLLSNPEREREKILALAAKNRFTELVTKHPDAVVKMDCSDFDKYGRLLVILWNGVDEKSINEMMIEEGHGKKYDGGKKDSWV